MSALHRSNRSRSKTAPETGAPIPSDTGRSTPTQEPTKAPTPEPLESPEPTLPPLSHEGPHPGSNAVAKNTFTRHTQDHTYAKMSGQTNGMALLDIALNGGAVDAGDEGSSSLSEPEESVEDRDEAVLREHASPDADDNDSEAETERIDSTPRKLARTATDVTNGSEGPVGRSPSKLARVMTIEHDNTEPNPPTSQLTGESDLGYNSDEDILPDVQHDVEADPEDLYNAEGSPRKRKRSSSALTSIGDDLENDQPARKRSSPARPYALNGDPMEIEGEVEHALDDDDEPMTKGANVLADDDDHGEMAREVASEPRAVSKKLKGKKGPRRGKKGRAAEQDEPTATPVEIEDDEAAEGELDGEDSGVIEERGRKHNALEELNKIEKQFLTFQKRRLEEQLERLSIELEQLRQPSSTHHEYLLMLQAVDKRRDEKIRQEDVRLGLRRDIIKNQFVAMRDTVHGQYAHDIGETRMDYLTQCNQRVTQLQRERRYWGTNEADFSIKFNSKRSQQVQQQTAYNLEVSVLSGVAKYVGFPAAPNLTTARAPEMDQDLAAMGIQSRPALPVRPSGIGESSRADRAAAEEQFFEQNAWANPNHPAHQQAHYHPMTAPQQRVTSNPFATPAAQRDRTDLQAPNGSASTIDMQSNPPSSAAAPGQGSAQQREVYESPVLQLKQALARSDNHTPAETPIRPGPHQPHEPTRTESNLHQPRDIYDNSSLLSRLGGSGAQPGPDGTVSSSIKDEDASEQLQRAAMPRRTGVAVGGPLFR